MARKPSALSVTLEGKRRLIADMAMSSGWQALTEDIAVKLDAATARLTRGVELSLDDVRLLQGEIRAYSELLTHVNTCVEKVQEKGE